LFGHATKVLPGIAIFLYKESGQLFCSIELAAMKCLFWRWSSCQASAQYTASPIGKLEVHMLNLIKGHLGLRTDSFLRLTAIALLPTILLIAAGTVSAQRTSGQLIGTVTDPNGAAVIGATVVAVQTGTNLQREATTNEDGLFTITDLPIGEYRISVKSSGFKESVSPNVTVNVASSTRQDFKLEVGAVGEIVTIQSSDVQVETQTGAIGEVVDGQQVRELPLNGRSFVQLTQLQPGVSPQNNFDSKNKGLFSGVDFSVNGNSAQSNLFLTDGANNNDTGSNRTVLLYPSIEAIAEFKMLRNSYGPEYGQAAGAVISLATRGGTNKFHGSLFYFGRNDALNAADYFTNKFGSEKDSLRRNDFGGSLGGPIIKDRLFFFYSQEFNKEIRGATRFGNVPTQAERSGDFSGRSLLCNGRDPSDPAVIANVSPAGRALANLFPLPNITPAAGSCNNWSESLPSKIDFREENIRIDYNLTKNNQIFGRYTQDHWENPNPILFGAGLWGDDAFPSVESSWSQPSKQAAIKLTTTLSSTAVNEVQFSYSANRINIVNGAGGDINREINELLPGFFPDSDKVNGIDRPHPVFWGGLAPFTNNRGADLWTQAPFNNSLDIYSIRDDFSKVMGNHAFKTGFLFDKAFKAEDAGPSNEAPQFWGACTWCSGTYTDGGAANLYEVLTRGNYFGYAESDKQAVADTRYTNLEFYFGDTWKIRPNVTLELGARYSLLFEPYDGDDEISSFLPELYNPALGAVPCNGLVVPKGTNPCSEIAGAATPTEFSNRSLKKNNFKNIAPRIGVAWDVFKNGKTAVRGGLGQFFLRERVSPVLAALTSNPPFVRSVAGTRQLDIGGTINTDSPPTVGAPAYSFDPEAATPYSWQFNVSVDQEVWKGAVLEVAYVGNRARNQLTNYNINPVLSQNRLKAAFATGIGFGDNATNEVNSYRVLGNQSWGSIYQFARRGRADYDSLQLLFKTRFWNNSQFQAAYTYGKSRADFGLSDSSGGRSDFALLDLDNPDIDFGPSDINRPHLFVANTVVNIPTFANSNKFVRTLLGGWEFASIIQITSGTSFTPNIAATGLSYFEPKINPTTINNDPNDGCASPLGCAFGVRGFAGGFTGTGTAVANQRPLFAGSCEGAGDPEQIIGTGAYTLTGVQIGETTSSDSKGRCLGPGIRNVDFSLYKNFTPKWLRDSFFGEEARIQFRIEMFNAFNTAQFRGDSMGINYYGGEVVCGANPCSATNTVITGIVGGSPGNFGRAGSTRGPREIQYALKFIF